LIVDRVRKQVDDEFVTSFC